MISDQNLSELQAAWRELQTHLATFQATLDRCLGAGAGLKFAPPGVMHPAAPAPAPAPTPAAAAAPAPDLRGRETHLLQALYLIAAELSRGTEAFQAAAGQYQNAWTRTPPQLIQQQLDRYRTAIANYEAHRPEAAALAAGGLGSALSFLDANQADCRQAFTITSQMGVDNQAAAAKDAQTGFAAQQALTDTMIAMNGQRQGTFAEANKAFNDYLNKK